MSGPLPDLIEIDPLPSPVTARVTVPGSKSVTNRALILAALAEGTTSLRGALWSEDTQAMTDALRALGYSVTVEPDPAEAGNRTITVVGQGGVVPAGPGGKPLDIYVANAGTAARFLTAFLALGRGTYRVYGVPRMHERPQEPLITALRSLGYRVDSENGRLPAVIHGGEGRPGKVSIRVDESSQFASALLMAGTHGGWEVDIVGHDEEETPYVEMTRMMIRDFPRNGGDYGIEPDASGGCNFIATRAFGHDVEVAGWPSSGMQVDAEFRWFVPLPAEISRTRDLGDSIMTAIVLAPFAGHPVRFTDLGRLRVQECERVAALRTELTKCGARVEEEGDTLTVYPSVLHGAEIDTYEDHRMAMCFGVVGLKVPGIRLRDPGCVRKTFPGFFQKLAMAAPAGLGAVIRDASGRPLAVDELGAG